MGGKLDNLEEGVQQQWKTSENIWKEKIVHSDDKQVSIFQAEFRIRMAVHQDVEERWKTRMENEDKMLRCILKKMAAQPVRNLGLREVVAAWVILHRN